jgi:hypothetical protein
LNDQLKQEFRDRVGRKSIVYTRKLSDALKSLEISVTQEEMKAEEDTLRIMEGDNISLSDVIDVTSQHSLTQERRKVHEEYIKQFWADFRDS